MVAHATETAHEGEPSAGEGGDVHTVARVVLEVAQIHERGLEQVGVGEVEMPHLCRDDGLRARRQRRVAHGQALVVVERARLLLLREAVPHPVQCEDEVGLLDDLLAVQIEVRVVHEQRVGVGLGALGKIPHFSIRRPGELLVDPALSVVVHRHPLRRVTPACEVVVDDAEGFGLVLMAFGDVRRVAQVTSRRQVRVRVVVDDGAVLVRPGHSADVEAPVVTVIAERHPQTCRLDEQRQRDLPFERRVRRPPGVTHRGEGDVGVDVHRGRARRPVSRALLAADRAPRERRALELERRRTLTRQVEAVAAPHERVTGRLGRRRAEHRQDEGLGVPERVTVVPGPRQALRGYRAPLGAGPGLQDVPQPEPDGLLYRRVTVDLDVGAAPELFQVRALLVDEGLPAGVQGGRERAVDLIAQ